MGLNQYGTLWGDIPRFVGRVFWVSPAATYLIDGKTYTASDNGDGQDPYQALRTIARALTLCTADQGDVIILLPGTHVPTASLAMSKAGVTLMGLPVAGHHFAGTRTIITGLAGDETINVTAANCAIANLQFTCATAVTCIDIAAAATYIHDCYFVMNPTASTSTVAIDNISGGRGLFERLYFNVTGAQGPAIRLAGQVHMVRECTFNVTSGAWAAAVAAAAGGYATIDSCEFIAHTTHTITAGVDGTAANVARSWHVSRCRFSNLVTVPIDNFDATECDLMENYKMGVGAGDGGTLITAIT